MVGKILTSIFGGVFVIALGLIIAYLAIPGFKKAVDDGLNKDKPQQEEVKEDDGTEEDVEVPETTAFISFANNTISIEV